MPQQLPDPLDLSATAVTSAAAAEPAHATDRPLVDAGRGGVDAGLEPAPQRDAFAGLEPGLAAALRGLEADLGRLAAGAHHDPHGVLGPHRLADGRTRVLLHVPHCTRVELEGGHRATRLPGSDFFAWVGEPSTLPARYRVTWWEDGGARREQVDPYCFVAPQLTDHDLYLFNEGRHFGLWKTLGARPQRVDGVDGVLFAVWAPDAMRVSVVGPFCRWDGRRYPLRSRGASGTWELFVPGIGARALYKFEIRNRVSGELLQIGRAHV